MLGDGDALMCGLFSRGPEPLPDGAPFGKAFCDALWARLERGPLDIELKFAGPTRVQRGERRHYAGPNSPVFDFVDFFQGETRINTKPLNFRHDLDWAAAAIWRAMQKENV